MEWTATDCIRVGYGDLSPKSQTGRLFSVLFIPVGIAVVLKQLHEIGDALFEHRYHRLIAPQIDRMTAKLRKASPRASPKSPSGGGGGRRRRKRRVLKRRGGSASTRTTRCSRSGWPNSSCRC